MLINPRSLSQTVDAINAATFEGTALSVSDRRAAARWIVARQGLPGAYGDTFAGFPSEREKGIVLFTGERISSASARHILGEESSRVLRLLDVKEKAVDAALDRADAGLMKCLERSALDPRHTNPGLYCCGKCSVGLWRNLLAGDWIVTKSDCSAAPVICDPCGTGLASGGSSHSGTRCWP